MTFNSVKHGYTQIEILLCALLISILSAAAFPCITIFDRTKLEMAAYTMALNIRTTQIMAINKQKSYYIEIYADSEANGRIEYTICTDAFSSKKYMYHLPAGIKIRGDFLHNGSGKITYNQNGNTAHAKSIYLYKGNNQVKISVNPCVGRSVVK